MTVRFEAPDQASDRLASILFVLTAVLVVAYTLCAGIVGPSMYADQGTGFLALDAWRRGGPFNEIAVADPADIARDQPFFVAWWSPGQYMVPGLFEWLGLPRGLAITAVLLVSAVLNLVGLFVLYRRWGFPRISIAITLLVLAGTRLFSHQFAIYGGGEVLLAAATPWFILLVMRLRDFTPLGAVVLFFAIAFMTFLKLSGLVLSLAIVGTFVFLDLLSDRPGKIRRMVMAVLPFLVFAVVFQLLWASRGETPTTAAANVLAPGRLLTHAIPAFVAPFTSIVSAGDFAAAVLSRPGYVLIDNIIPFYFAAAVPVAILAWAAARTLAQTYPDYLRFAAVLTLVFSGGMVLIYIKGGEVSLEDRQFRQVGFVLAIGMVHAILQWRRPIRVAAMAGAAVLVAYGLASFAVKTRTNIASAQGNGGIRHMVLSPTALAFIRSDLDKPRPGNSLLVVQSAEIGLELPGQRVLEIPLAFRTAEELARRYVHRGKVDHLGVLVETRLVDSGQAAILLAGFKDYPMDRWKKTQLGTFTYYSQDRP